MWNLMRHEFNTNTFKRLLVLISSKNHAAYPMENVHTLTYLNRHGDLTTQTQINVVTFGVQCCGTLNSTKQFSTSEVLLKGRVKPKNVDFMEMEEFLNVEKLMSEYECAIESLKGLYVKNLSLRTNFGSIEELEIEFEGVDYKLQDLVEISRKPKLVVLNATAFPQTIPQIMQILGKSNMNLNPQQDGTNIYIQIPKVTKEHREKLAKDAKNLYNKSCVSIRDVRNKYIKKLKTIPALPQDSQQRLEGYIDTLHRQYIGKAQTMLEVKQKELLGD